MTCARTLWVCSWLTVGMNLGVVQAQDLSSARSAYVVTRPEPGVVRADRAETLRVALMGGHGAVVVLHPVVDPSLTVDRAVSRQPVQPWLVPVRYANTTTIYVDPLENYRPHAGRGIDLHHSILKAQRLGLDRMTLPTRVIRNPLAPAVQPDERMVRPQPIFKFRKPLWPDVQEPLDLRKVAMAD